MRFVRIAIFAVVTLIAAACENPFAPAVIGPSRIVPIVRQTTPDSALHNFKYAYEHRDIDVYENCLDNQFIFRYIDQDRTGQIEQVEISRDGPSGDLARTERLFRLFDEITLETWVPVFDRQEFPNDEVWEVYRVYFNLSVKDLDGDFGYEFFEAVGIAEFKFRKSATDSLYRIVIWDDRSNR
ncbi:MAG: hypothetical protein WBP29_06890 [Candidatus Zixiibacteriota bacterium]